jgi:hypothetical protein
MHVRLDAADAEIEGDFKATKRILGLETPSAPVALQIEK